jgi:mannose-6-phosphate isomerase-like protein (cupin superfamily)
MQLVLMSIPVGSDIELEVHKDADQFIRIEKGEGELHIGQDEKIKVPIRDGSALIIEKGTYHRVLNVGKEALKLYTLYSPAQHKIMLEQKNRPPTGSEEERGKEEKRNNYKKLLVSLLNQF